MFEALGTKLNTVFSRLKSRGVLTEALINEAIREIRIALFEADVALPVVKELIASVREEALGQRVLESIAPGQQIIKIVFDHLVKALGEKQVGLSLKKKPAIILMVGLQGVGKTTATAKISNFLQKTKTPKKILMASLDVHRPAAQEQLRALGDANHIETLGCFKNKTPLQLAKMAVDKASKESFDALFLDTSGRTNLDEVLLDELKQVEKACKPEEVLFVADAMMGQESINVAKAFHEAVSITGIVLTRIDGDARGGAALSIYQTLGMPIKFIGVGEKIEDLEAFYPDRIAKRILGMGDVVSLVEQAQTNVDEAEAAALTKKLGKGQFDLDDMLSQMQQLKKMGGMKKMLGMIPGMNALKKKVDPSKLDDKKMMHQEAIILSMTKIERKRVKIIGGSRKKRIAVGSGTSVIEVNRLLKQFLQMQKMMKKVGKMGEKGLVRGGLQNLLPKNMGM